jgi:hypothetical protein
VSLRQSVAEIRRRERVEDLCLLLSDKARAKWKTYILSVGEMKAEVLHKKKNLLSSALFVGDALFHF